MIPLRALSRLRSEAPRVEAAARCELCGHPLAERHGHVVEIGRRGVQCACRPCALLFERSDASTPYRTVPDRVLVDRSFAMTARQWSELGIPVRMAFVHRDSTREHPVVGYPGPAGVTDAELEPSAWRIILEATPLAHELQEDVEALLVHGGRFASRLACHLVPITTIYDLAGRLRGCWRGFSGGEEADRVLVDFFAELEERGDPR